jgi:hypothetical protein
VGSFGTVKELNLFLLSAERAFTLRGLVRDGRMKGQSLG